MPWHYHDPFFQESPAVFDADLDEPLRQGRHPRSCAATSTRASACRSTTCIARSDLYEKKGKSPHAFCTDIDREGDVRVLANIVPNEYWMGTMLHELGHAVYSSKNIPRDAALRAAQRGAHPDHRRRGDDVRAVLASARPGWRRWA